MKILVTGAYGQLGNEIKELEKQFPGYQFFFTDVDMLDIANETETEVFFEEHQPDFVVNCAAYTAVDKAETEEELAKKVNSVAPGILAKISRQFKARLIHISTDYVFDGNSNKPYEETDAVNPNGIYGKTKLQGEINCLQGHPEALIIRTSWLYSSFGNNFVKTVLRLGRERSVLNVVFDQVGTPTYAADLAGTVMAIIKKSEKDPKRFMPGIYHYSNEGAVSWYDFAKAILELSGIECEVLPVLSDKFPSPVKRPHYSVLNKSKIRDTFDIKIPYWRDSLKNCLAKIENNG